MKRTYFGLVLVLAALLGLLGAAEAQPAQLNYRVGQEFAFAMNSHVDARHADSQTLQAGGGSVANMASTVVYQCTDADATSYLFVMNMFGTTVSVAQNAGAASERSSAPISLGVGKNNALGQNMYFQQLKTGEIVKVWYNTGDSPYFVNVKAGAINAFQTRMVPANQQAVQYQETDLIGVHTSNFVGSSASGSLNIAKSFNQADFKTFATDPKLTSKDIILNANQGVSVHPTGYIQSTSFDQKVLLVQTQRQTSKRDSNDGLDMFMLSHGQMNINLQQVNMVKGEQRTASSRFEPEDALTFDALHNSNSFSPDTFHAFAAKSALFTLQNPLPVNVTEALAEIFAAEMGPRTFSQMNRLIRYLRVYKQEISVLREYLKRPSVMDQASRRERAFYILAALEASPEIIEFGLASKNRDVRMQAIVTAAILQAPTSDLAGSLFSLYHAAEDSHMKHVALLAYGAVLQKLDNPTKARAGGEALVTLLDSTPSTDVNQLATVFAAIKNAGPDVVPRTKFLFKAMSMYKRHPGLKSNIKRLLKEYVAKNSELDMRLDAILQDSSFPFNRSFEKDLVIGGHAVNLDLKGQLFIGTNFDCNQQYFNYEGLAEVEGDVTLFTDTANVFKAQAIYGAENGVHLADDISLVFLGRTIYDRPLPQVDCMEHTYNLFHTAPALSASYVVWISVIPVVFSASASVSLNVDWGWSICDSQLSALIELIPGATFTAQGDVELDLLIIKAGIELAAQINTQIHPQAYIHGTQCEVGIDVERTNNPMNAYFESFYQLKDCKLWIFDCKWKNKDTQVWWQWQQPSSSSIIFNEDWKIKL